MSKFEFKPEDFHGCGLEVWNEPAERYENAAARANARLQEMLAECPMVSYDEECQSWGEGMVCEYRGRNGRIVVLNEGWDKK